MLNRRGQMTIFVILAIVLVAGIALYFTFRGDVSISEIPADFQPIYEVYQSCIELETANAVDLAGSQAGFVFLDEYEIGSDFAPFSNQLDFLGFPVPYWYYVTGNGLIKENVPSRSDIEDGIERYVEDRLSGCDLDVYYEQGFYIDLGEPEVDVVIEDLEVRVVVNADISSSREDQSAIKRVHEVSVTSKIGKFYDIARKIYDDEKENAFLEEYGVDVLRLYAPVDDVEISCSGKIWRIRDVVDEIKAGLEGNVAFIKVKGDYYSISDERNEYFVVDSVESDEAVNFIYDQDWPSRIEVEGNDGELLIAEPIGNQQGLGAMGFCYSPYHFVYDLMYPVMIQVYDNEEIFQFPVVSVIDNNLPREKDQSAIGEAAEIDGFCDFATEDIEVRLFDNNLNSADGAVSYRCFDNKCALGETENGVLEAEVTSCLNGFIDVRAPGFGEKKVLFSSNEESSVDIILDREYEVEIELRADGVEFDGTSIISFIGERSTSAALPDGNRVTLTEGRYNVSVYAYSDSGIVIPGETRVDCIDIPKGGLLGVFGVTEEECFEIEIPDTEIDFALAGGGETEEFILESQLEGGSLIINIDRLPVPDTLQQLQYNYESFEEGRVFLSFT